MSSSFRIAGNEYHMKLGLKRLSEAKKWYITFAVVEGLGEQKWSISQGKSDEQWAWGRGWMIRDRSLFMEGGEGNFFFPKFLKLKAPP